MLRDVQKYAQRFSDALRYCLALLPSLANHLQQLVVELRRTLIVQSEVVQQVFRVRHHSFVWVLQILLLAESLSDYSVERVLQLRREVVALREYWEVVFQYKQARDS